MTEERIVVCFMDKVDFDYEVGAAHRGNRVYPSVVAVEDNQPCSRQCGIVEVELRYIRTVREEVSIREQIAGAKVAPLTQEEKERDRQRATAIRKVNDQIRELESKRHRIIRGESIA